MQINQYLHPSKDTKVYTASNPFLFDLLSDLNFTITLLLEKSFTSHPPEGMVPHLLFEKPLSEETFIIEKKY